MRIWVLGLSPLCRSRPLFCRARPYAASRRTSLDVSWTILDSLARRGFLSVDRRHPFLWAWGCPRLVPAAKALSGAYEEGDRGHAHHHQGLALGIGADALGELYWLPDY